MPPDVLAAIEAGAKQGLADIQEKASHTTSSIGIFGSRAQLGDDYLTRAVAAQMGIYGQIAEEAVYGGSRLDANGEQLLGDMTYTLRFEKDALPQAKFFWSLTLYRLPSRLLAANAIDRYSIGDRTPGITYAEDGSLEIALQPAEPTDPMRRANWLPTPAGEPFTVIYRLYGPWRGGASRDVVPTCDPPGVAWRLRRASRGGPLRRRPAGRRTRA